MSIFRRQPKPEPTESPYAAQRRREEEAGQVRGRHYVDWVPTIDELRTAGQDDEALDLLLEIVDAAEQVALVADREPAPGYTKRAAVIYRRRKDFAAEVAILERWQAACPPDRGDEAITDRLAKARELLAEQ